MRLNNTPLDVEKPPCRDSFRIRGYAHGPAHLEANVSPVYDRSPELSPDTAGISAGTQDSRPHGVGFWLVVASFLVSMAFSAASAHGVLRRWVCPRALRSQRRVLPWSLRQPARPRARSSLPRPAYLPTRPPAGPAR
jgi:hypothetical protein